VGEEGFLGGSQALSIEKREEALNPSLERLQISIARRVAGGGDGADPFPRTCHRGVRPAPPGESAGSLPGGRPW
jgi:hypothetical protein